MTAASAAHAVMSPREATIYPRYRPDIDGLRAVAILSVLSYHAFPAAMPGGFIGVDIFFVISGFLIASIIFRGLLHGRFSFLGFYGGRIRRLFPALLIVLTSAFAVGWFSLLPDEFAQFGKHVAGGIGFSDNILLWQESGYFDRAAELKPLLHLWSLGIEEQYYLVFPGMVWLLWHWRNHLLVILASLGTLSFFFNLSFVGSHPVAAFFLPQFRVWELLVGASLASWHLRQAQVVVKRTAALHGPNIESRLLDLVSIAGLLLIAVALATIRSTDDFPGWWAVLPVFGSAALMAAGPHALVNRMLLSHPLPVFLGLISYPLYLWHWPLLSFVRIIEGGEPSASTRAGLMAAAVLLAWLTYRLVERPIRFGPRPLTKTGLLACAAAVVGFIGFNDYQRDGLPFRKGFAVRVPSVLQPLAAYRFDDDRHFRSGLCHLRVSEGPEGYAGVCADEADKGRASLFLWGDSHAAQFYPGLAAELPSIRLEQYTSPGCQPTLDWQVPGFPRCVEINAFVMRKIEELKPDQVVLVSRWLGVAATDKIKSTIARIKAAGVKDIVIIGPLPRWEPNLLGALLSRYHEQPFTVIPERMRNGVDADKFRIDRELQRLATESGARYISPMSLLCNDDGCLVRPTDGGFEGMSLAFDDSHLTPEGSRYVVALLRKARVLGHD
ncbi:MAG TPA: acyltransferase family protein [Rhodocyclaceae bacterium]|nr:acyltransferase family protein [Rhodocyclaceae bacterium]